MTEPNPSPDAPVPDSAPAAKLRKRKRSWKRRLMVAALVVVVLLVAFRAALQLLLPTVIRKVAGGYGLDCTYGRMELSLTGGNAQIWDMTLRPRGGGESIISTDYLQGNLSTLNLFRGRLVVYRVEVDGADLLIDRNEDGTIPLLARFAAGATGQPATPGGSPAGEPMPLSLEVPMRIDAIRLSHVTARWRDRSVSPALDTTIRTTMRISDVGSPQRPIRFELEVRADPLLDALLIQGQASSTPTAIDGVFNLALRGLHPKPAEGYLLPVGLKPIADDISVHARMSVKAAVIANTTDIAAQLDLTEIVAQVDQQEWAGVDRLSVNAKRLSTAGVELSRLLIEGAHASARRTPSGSLQVAGMELVPVASAAEQTGQAPQPAASSFRFELNELRMKDLQARFDDQAIHPAGAIAARLAELNVNNIVLDPSRSSEKATITAAASIPGVIRTIDIAGAAVPFGQPRRLDLKLVADGIKPEALAPYLAAMGVKSNFRDGKLTADLSATTAVDSAGRLLADASLSGIRLEDGEELLAFKTASIGGLAIDPGTGGIRVESIRLVGPALPIRRTADGLAMLGLQTQAIDVKALTSAAPAAAPATAPASAPLLASALPRLEIGQLTWTDLKLRFTDDLAAPPSSVEIGDAGVELSNLVIDLDADQPAPPGQFRAWLAAPEIAERLSVQGTLTPAAKGVAIESSVTGDGITARALVPYLSSLGITPVLEAGRLRLKAAARLDSAEDGIRSSLTLEDFAYSDGETELAGADAVRIESLAIRPAGVEIGQVRIDHPRARAQRNEDGTLQAGGIRVAAPKVADPSAATASTTPAEPAPLRLAPAALPIALAGLHVREASFDWTDLALAAPVHTTLTTSVDLDNLHIGRANAETANLEITARIAGAIDRATVSGVISAAPDAPAARLIFTAENIRAGDLAAYLPPGFASTLKQGRFAGMLDAGVSNHPDGGLTGRLVVENVELTDGEPLLKLGSFKVLATRLDPAGGAIAVAEISSSGVEADVAITPDGAIEAGGIRVSAVPAGAAPVPIPADAAAIVAAPEPATRPAPDVAALVAEARRPLARLTLDKLDLGIDRLSLRGIGGPDAAPLVLAATRLRSRNPISLGGVESDRPQPVDLDAAGALQPVVGRFQVDVHALPLATTPTLSVDLRAGQINGKGLTDLLPELRPMIDGTGLTQGTFNTRLDASINYGRRGPRDLDLSRGFTLDLVIKPIEYRAEPNGPVLAGLDEIRSDGIKVEPATGDVRIKSIEITKPTGRIERDDQGLRALGLLIPLSTGDTGQTAAPSDQPAAEAPAAPAAVTTVPPQRPSNEIRLDRLTVSGIDVLLTDKTSTPNTIVPLNGLDIDVRDISNQMPFSGRPVRFSMLVTSDKVPLPPRKGAAASEPAGGEAQTEMRELFSQVTAGGKIAIKQRDDGAVVDGWAKTSVNGFELLGISGMAKEFDVTISGGVFDSSNDIRFNPSGNIDTRNKLVLTNLSLSEPPNGPIQRTLKLSAPVDVAIGLVTDPDGSITMNLPVPVKNGAVKPSDIIAPAIGAVAGVLGTAVASAPVKAIGGVGGLLGIGGNQKPVAEEPVTIAFLPGYTRPDDAGAEALARLRQRLADDRAVEVQLRHELSAGDVARMSVRANPGADETRLLADRLRREKQALIARRATLAGQARGELGSRQEEQAQSTLEALRAVDSQIAQTENALDQLYDLLRPGAQRQADRRTRAASLDIARQRLEAVRGILLAGASRGMDQRIHQTNPQYAPDESPDGGRVVITIVTKKK